MSMNIGYGKWLAEINDLSLLLLGSFLAEKPGSKERKRDRSVEKGTGIKI